jgi:cyclomaltodextrinase / maltogenic alpha-amylase / neopullulanase
VPSRASRVRRYADDLGILGLPGDVAAWDLRFDVEDPAHLEAIGDGRFRLRLQTEPGFTEARAVLRTSDGIVGVPLEPASAGRFVYWTVVVGPFDEPAELSFALLIDERPVYLVPAGVSASVERLDRWTIDPLKVATDTPAWAQGTVIYQIFPDRFAKGDPETDPPGTVPWEAPPTPRQFHGGDLVGVLQRLDHLERIGVDAIYLNPVFTSPSNHKYDTVDYMKVDPAFGGDEALRRLVSATHDRGMRIILDASFNHAHPRFFAFADLVRRQRRSEYRDWFVVRDWPPRIRFRPQSAPHWVREWMPSWEDQTGVPVEVVDGDGPPVEPTYDTWNGVPTMPRINLANPGAREFMLGVARYWLESFDIDGWRMDVARYVDPDFWPDLRATCRAAKADTYLLAEIMGDVSPWLKGDSFDATMNYTFRSLAVRFFATGELDGHGLLDHSARLYARHPLATTLANHNLIGSHDTPRFRTVAGGELWRLELATVFQLLFPGAPGIYYGDELGLEGENDPGSRAAMPWSADGTVLERTITELAALRRRIPALRSGTWAPLAASRDLVAFERRLGRSRYRVGINRSDRSGQVDVPGNGSVVWGRGSHENGRLRVNGRSAVLIRA